MHPPAPLPPAVLLTLLRRVLAGDPLPPEAAAALVVEVLRLRATAAACAEWR